MAHIPTDGGHIWIPRSSDLRIQSLTGNGPEGSTPDDVFQALRAQGHIGSLDDMWRAHIAALGITDTSEPFELDVGVVDFEEVKLQLTFEGTDGGQDITDLSNGAHVDSVNGQAQIDDSTAPFVDTKCGLFDGDDNFYFADHDDWTFGLNSFTVELHMYVDPSEVNGIMIGQWNGVSGQAGWYLQFRNPNTLRFAYSVDGDAVTTVDYVTSGITDATWYHVAVSRENGAPLSLLRMFLDGVEQGTTHNDSHADYANATSTLGVGAVGNGVTVSSGFIGRLANIRVTNGSARYIEDFTPPSAQYIEG